MTDPKAKVGCDYRWSTPSKDAPNHIGRSVAVGIVDHICFLNRLHDNPHVCACGVERHGRRSF